MAKVVVIVNGVTITEFPVKGVGIPEPMQSHLTSTCTLTPCTSSTQSTVHLMSSSSSQSLAPSSSKIIRHSIHRACNCMVVPDIHPIRINKLLHCIPRDVGRPGPPFLISAQPNKPFLHSSMMPLSTQKPESRMMYLAVWK